MSEGGTAAAPEQALSSGVVAHRREPCSDQALGPDLSAVTALEAHCVKAWPPAFVQETSDGWILRATPGLPGRGRSNHALTPPRMIDPSEYDGAIERAAAFAAGHGVECGMQISPTDVHAPLVADLAQRGWRVGGDVIVMAAGTQAVAASEGDRLELSVQASATAAWVAAWAHCDRRSDVDDHLAHVFPRMAGIANFVHSGNRAVGISVELDGIVGLFCLAIDPDSRRQGLGKALVRSMLAHHAASLTYLQVFGTNSAALALYRSLGFREIYRYRHAVAPVVGS